MRSLVSSVLLVIVGMFSIQIGASIAKQLFPLAGVAGTSALRVTLSALIISVVAKVWKHKISKRELFLLIGYGVSLGLMNLLFYFSIERIPLGVAVAVEFTGPLAISLLYSKRSLDFIWVIFAGLGIYLFLPKSTSTQENLDLLGIILALLAGFFWALYIIFGKSVAKKGSSLQTTALGMIFAAIVVLPFGIFLNGPEMTQVSLLPMALGIAVLSSAIPYSLEMKAMQNIPAKTFGILMSLEPVVAVAMGFVILKETLQTSHWIAIACIVTASVGSVLFGNSKEKIADPT